MKRTDSILITTALIIFVGLLLCVNALAILKIVVCIIALILVLYWKILPYKSQLYPQYAKVADAIAKIVNPVLQLFNKMPNIRLGDKLFVDTKYLVLYSLLLIVLVII